MRFIGNKELITTAIIDLLEEKGLVCIQHNLFSKVKEYEKPLTFFDAFCGTGAVADSLKGHLNLVVNDMIKWSVVYTRGRLTSADCDFKKLGFNPFTFFNNNKEIRKNFFYKNYSPGGSKRMYFTPENAGRIDYFRETIEQWKKENLINDSEYSFLLASLIESISFVSNTAGVYGAFLKHWDPRAKKPIIFQKVDSNESHPMNIQTFNNKIEDIIEDVDCDILYLDPPYTQNQYGTQYHLLQTLVLNDTPSISPITGSRPTTPMRSDWSKDYKSHILFDRIIAKTKAKYIIFSYSVDGFLSKSFIEASLKRYGKADTYMCKKISYSKYTNFKSRRGKEHFEYLFYVEKKETNEIKYESPLNYIGSKAKMISFSRIVKEKNISFKNSDYSELYGIMNNESFVYLDPPYRLTTGSYNDGKRGFNGWGIEEEKRLFDFADFLNSNSIRFMISYVIEHKESVNEELKEWIQTNGYRLINVNDVPGIQRKEVLIVNYDKNGDTTLCNKEQVSKRRALPRPLEPSYID